MCRKFASHDEFMRWMLEDGRKRLQAAVWGAGIGKPGLYHISGYPVDPSYQVTKPTL